MVLTGPLKVLKTLWGTFIGSLCTLLYRTLKGSQRVLGYSGTIFEGSRIRVPYTGQRRTLLAPFFLSVYIN